MNPLTRDDFAEFFRTVRGFAPFPWQERLLDHLITEEGWPDQISAPTGAGKTSVIDVHVFANALHAVGNGPRVPRRLAVVVDRRVLVDSHSSHADLLRDALDGASEGVLASVAAALRSLVPDPLPSAVVGDAPTALQTVRLRGGVPASRGWRVEPEVCSVLTTTNDMFGSRLLLGGYGTPRRARPQEAALLALDCVAVVDEAHLSRQLLLTARRVAELVQSAPETLGVPVLQVVETTATPDRSGSTATSVGVEERDLDLSPALADRLLSPKPVAVTPINGWPAGDADSSKRRMASAVADAVDAVIAEVTEVVVSGDRARTVGCVLNRVADAVAVARELRRRQHRVVLLTGRMRQVDRVLLDEQYPGLLSIEGNSAVEVLVSTQVLEVGVDVDLAGLVTDLAPGSAIVQRAGRVNRLGRRARGPVRVIVPSDPLDPEKSRTAPYAVTDLQAARDWLDEVAEDERGLAPWALQGREVPSAEARRTLWQRLGVVDSRVLARTSTPQFAEPDLSLWISDDLRRDDTVGVVLRHLSDEEHPLAAQNIALDLLRTTPPSAHEAMPLSRTFLRNLLEEVGEDAPRFCFRPGDDTMSVESFRQVTGLRNGDIVVLDARVAAAGLLPWLARVSPVDTEAPFVTDAYELGERALGRNHLRVGLLSSLTGDAASATVQAAAAFEEDSSDENFEALLAAASELQGPTALSDLIEALPQALVDGIVEPFVLRDDEEQARTVVFVDNRTTLPAEDLLQVWSRRPEPVLLDDHQAAVADRVVTSAQALGMSTSHVETLRLAALHHDDGKAHEQFQRGTLGASEGGPLLAKSGRTSAREAARNAARAQLPRGWRHEQLSVLLAARSDEVAGAADADLVLRLIGTSHGNGRPSFPHGSRELLTGEPEDAAGQDWFDDGVWEAVVEATDARWSPWGTAYLEMVLRAADVRISREGS